jgi:hypothetical protein
MRSLHSRLKKLEARRGQNRVPRIAVQHEHHDGRVEITESRPPEGDDDETMEMVVQYADAGGLWALHRQRTPDLASDNGN